jgi:secretion/DNA translocation related TadE-like protein
VKRPVGDRGSATIWVLATCVLLLVLGGVATVRAAAVLARHRAEATADVAALAAAGQLGTGRAPCAAAGWVARRNSARLESCRVRADPAERGGVVDVVVSLAVRLPGIGVTSVRASARAGRGVGVGGAVAPVEAPAPAQFGAIGLRRIAVWHAGPRRPTGRASREQFGATATRRVSAWRSRFRGMLPRTSPSCR